MFLEGGIDVLRRDVLPREKGQEVLGIGRCRRGKNACKESEKTNDFIGIFVFLAKNADVHADICGVIAAIAVAAIFFG